MSPKIYQKFLGLLILLLITSPSFAEMFMLPPNSFAVDNKNNIAVAYLLPSEMKKDLSKSSSTGLLMDGKFFIIKERLTQFSYKRSYTAISSGKEYTIYLTKLPLINITCDKTIQNEPKIAANFSYYDSLQSKSSIVGIELRGGSSQSFPKKTYDLEFWKDVNGDSTKDMQFGQLRSDDDWVLDALYNEPLRIRSFTAHNLWNDLHNLYYQDEEPNAKCGAGTMLSEVFLNSEYKGLYMFMEQVDRSLLKLKKNKTEIRGELFKGVDWSNGVLFKDDPSYNNSRAYWSGFEYKYPKDEIDWSNLYDCVSFVVNSSDSDFEKYIWDYIQEDNYIDYFIYLNVITARDNQGKNIYYARYDNDEPYFLTPWDLDGCFGTSWTGSQDEPTDEFLCSQSNLYQRIYDLEPQNYKSQFRRRYHELRTGEFGYSKMMNRFDSVYNFLKDNCIYEREALIWDNYEYNDDALLYLKVWTSEHLDYLDDLFSMRIIDGIQSTEVDVQNKFYYDALNRKFIIKGNNIDNKSYSIYSTSGLFVSKGIIQNNQISLYTLNTGIYILSYEDQRIKFRID